MHPEQLSNMLTYQNEDIISRFTDQYAITDTEAEDIFIETRKFLYLCQLPGIFIPDELLIVDEMWHNFILFTKEYHRFCTTHFGKYFHHLPASKQEKLQAKELNLSAPDQAQSDFEIKMSTLIGETYDHLGEETVIKWFQTYPQQYSKNNITQLRKY